MTDEAKQATHSINLNVLVDSPEQWTDVFGKLADVAGDLPPVYRGVSVSATSLDGIELDLEPELTYDENTINKVRRGLTRVLELRRDNVPDQLIDELIDEMQNEGILFRERR